MTDYFLLSVSAILFAGGIYIAGNVRAGTFKMLVFLVLSGLFFFLNALYFVADYFTGKGFNESVIYHLYSGLWGAGFGDYLGVILGGCTFLVCGIAGAYYVFSGKVTAGPCRFPEWSSTVSFSLVFGAIFINPVNVYLLESLKTEQRSDFYNYYRPPIITKRPDIQRNVIFIYAEGLERTYFDAYLFPGLVNELRLLESRSTYFTDIRQVWGTSWTMGGVVASHCGIPLVTPSHGNSMRGMDNFLGGAVCLGDLLEEDGYSLSYIGGAYLSFAGKGKFFSTHGFKSVVGREVLGKQLADSEYMNNWGLHDDTLFDIGYKEFKKLSEKGDPFGLFMLTLGTHPPDGSMSESCKNVAYGDGKNPILNATACSDILIARFVNRIIASGYGNNTIIVIASDHLSMKNTAYTMLENAERSNLLMIVDLKDLTERKISRIGSVIDVGPVLLHALGYKGSIGLGRDILAGETSLFETLKDIDESLKGWNKSLLDLWDFPRIGTGVVIDATSRTMTIDDRKFRIPSLVEYNENLTTRIKFQSDTSGLEMKLIDYVRKLGKDDPFIWIDYCRTISSGTNIPGICVVMGKLGSGRLKSFRVKGVSEISMHDIRTIILSRTSEEILKLNKSKLSH